jgi:PPOX class probable F420-dependent enzyme
LIVPITFELIRASDPDGDGDVLVSAIDHKPKSTPDLRRIRLLRTDPRVAVLVDRYDQDWDRLWWVRADGHAAILDASDPSGRRDESLAALARKYPQYRRQPPTGAVIWIWVDRWNGWAAE